MSDARSKIMLIGRGAMAHKTRDILVDVATRMRADWMRRVMPGDASTAAILGAHSHR